jgi:hypothetical protein
MVHIRSAGIQVTPRVENCPTILQYYVFILERNGVWRMTAAMSNRPEPSRVESNRVESNRAVRTAFQLIELLSGAPDGMRLARLVETSGLPRTTVHRLLKTLAELDIVCHDEDRYHLNARWQRFCGDQFSAPIVAGDGRHLAGLTLRTRGPVACEATADRLRRLVADLAVAVSRRIRT